MYRFTERRRRRSRQAAVLLMLIIMTTAAGAYILHLHSKSYGGSAINISNENEQSDQTSTEQAELLATLFFTSDYQYEDGWDKPAETLESILEAVEADGKNLNAAVFCGDYTNDSNLHDYQLSPDKSIQEIREITHTAYPEITEDNKIFVQGNHDALTDSISESGLHEFDNYLIYVLNTENDFPWKQGKVSGCLNKVTRAAGEMRECFARLIEEGETRPVFIAGHVPLHYTARTSSMHTTGDNLYSSLIFDVVNEAADSLDIVYLFGHNHSKGWDCYLGGGSVYLGVGEQMLIPEFTETDITSDRYTAKTLNFTYMNAGYSGYYMNCSDDEVTAGMVDDYRAADMALTGTICEIYQDRLVLSRYSGDGLYMLGAEGEFDPYKGGIDKDLIGNENYSAEISSPQAVSRKAVRDDADELGNYEGLSMIANAANAIVADCMAAQHVYSHRGSAGPEEHTFTAYDQAIEDGSMYIEQDVVISRDGTLYVSHDIDAGRITGAGRMYVDMTDEEIDKLRTAAGSNTLRLEDVFDRYGKTVSYVIELKSNDMATIDEFEDVVNRSGLRDRVIVQSFYASALESVEKDFPDMPKLCLCRTQRDMDYAIKLPYVDIVSVSNALMNEDNCSRVHGAGKEFNVWTLDSEDEIRRAIDIGVDTYFTNDTGLAINLEKRYRKH